MSLKHGVTDCPCPESDCDQRSMHPETAERHWNRVHGPEYVGRYTSDDTPASVDDDTVLHAIKMAHSRALNGEPDSMTIAEYCVLCQTSINQRLCQFEDSGLVECNLSLSPDINGEIKTAVVVADA